MEVFFDNLADGRRAALARMEARIALSELSTAFLASTLPRMALWSRVPR
jgi:hypothetical protein